MAQETSGQPTGDPWSAFGLLVAGVGHGQENAAVLPLQGEAAVFLQETHGQTGERFDGAQVFKAEGPGTHILDPLFWMNNISRGYPLSGGASGGGATWGASGGAGIVAAGTSAVSADGDTTSGGGASGT